MFYVISTSKYFQVNTRGIILYNCYERCVFIRIENPPAITLVISQGWKIESTAKNAQRTVYAETIKVE